MNNPNVYYERTLRLKPIVEQDTDLLQRIKLAFEATYDPKNGIYCFADRKNVSSRLSAPLYHLGTGNEHVVIGLDRVVTDPQTGYDVHLALRLNHLEPDNILVSLPLQLHAFEKAFEYGKNPPYFVGGAACSVQMYTGAIKEVAGMLTEDLSQKGKYRIHTYPDEEICRRVSPDGTAERFFLDPDLSFDFNRGEKYCSPEALIRLL